MNHLYRVKDSPAAEIVSAPFYSRPLDKVHRSAKYLGQLSLHVTEVEKGMASVRAKADKHIYVAVLSKVPA